MATTSPVSLGACLIKAEPVVAESLIAAQAAPDVATLPYQRSISHAYCCEVSVPCHCSQRTFAPDSAHRHQQRIIYAPKTIFAISSIWDTGLVPGGSSDDVRFCSASGRDTGNDGSASRFHWDSVYFQSTKRCPQSSQASVGVCDGHRTTEPQRGCDRSPSLSVVMALAYCMPILPPSEQAATSSSF